MLLSIDRKEGDDVLLSIKLHRIVKEKKDFNEYIPPHSHPYFHCVYVIDGEGKIVIDDETIIATKGTFIRINPDKTHSIFGINNFHSFDIKFTAEGSLYNDIASSPVAVSFSSYEESIVMDIFHQAVTNDLYTEEIVNARMTELMLLVLRKSESESVSFQYHIPDISQNNALYPALMYINANLSQYLSIADLAELCGYNSAYFSTVFKKTFGYSPLKYIALKKAERSKKLMLTTDLSITEIAESLGLELVTFSRMFKKIVGLSPLKYHNRANSDLGINVSKDSPYIKDADFEMPKKKF